MIVESRREIVNDLKSIVKLVPTSVLILHNKETYLPKDMVYRSPFLEGMEAEVARKDHFHEVGLDPV